LVLGKSPIRNVQVMLRGKPYTVKDVTTVSELQERIQEIAGANETGQVLFRGKELEPTDILRRVGVKEGATVTLVPSSSSPSEDILESPPNFKEAFSIMDISDWQDLLDHINKVNKDEVSTWLREGFGSIYDEMKKHWLDPQYRKMIDDPNKIEAARLFIVSNSALRDAIEEVDGGKELLKSQDKFRDYILSLNLVAIKAGDAIFDGVLEVLLDVLKGAGKHMYGPSSSSSSSRTSQDFSSIDPSVSASLLFELSESEDEE
jgi:hypothetical protein